MIASVVLLGLALRNASRDRLARLDRYRHHEARRSSA